MLESVFFCPPAASLTEVDAVEMIVADDLETEPGKSAAARIDDEHRDSAACKMMCDDDVAPVDFFDSREMCARQEAKSTCSDGDKTELVLGPLSSVMEHDKGIEFR